MKCLGRIIPKEEWDTGLLTLLVQNRRLDDVKKLLYHGIPCNDASTWSPLHEAAIQGNAEIAEVLIAAGADMDYYDDDGSLPLGVAINGIFCPDLDNYIRCAKVLIANGSRLYTIFDRQKRSRATQCGLFDFERRVLKCLHACIAFYHLRAHLRVGCKYMVRDIGIAIWSTRYDENW